MYWYNIYKKMLGIVIHSPQSQCIVSQIQILLKRLAMEMSECAASARNPRNENHTAALMLRLNRSMANPFARRWLRDAAADDADIRRYARTCSETKPISHGAREFRW